MRHATAILILSSLCSLGLLPDSVIAQEPEGEAAASAPAAPTPAVAGEPAAPDVKVTFQDGKLSVKAVQADLVLVLRRIARWAGVGVQMGDGVSGTVSTDFSGLTLEEGINRVLEAADARDYAAIFEKTTPTGAPVLQNIAVVRKGAGGVVPSWQSFPWPPKKKAILKTSGKEIEYFKGLFVIIPGLSWEASFRNVKGMPFEENVRHIESKYPLKKINGPGGRDFLFEERARGKHYLFEATHEVDELDLLRKLNDDDHISFASLYGLGKQSAVLPTDDKGRYRMLDTSEEERLIRAAEGKTHSERERLYMEVMPWLKKRCRPEFRGICLPYYEGRLTISTRDLAKDEAWVDDKMLELANDFGGVIVLRKEDQEYGLRFGVLFPTVHGEEIYQVMKEFSSRGLPAGVLPWETEVFRSSDPYASAGFQWALDWVGAQDAWTAWAGRNPSRAIDVAVVDSGIGLPPDPAHAGEYLLQPHPDFISATGESTLKLSLARDYSTGVERTQPSSFVDTHGHGTMVAGIIAAVGNNGRGIDGVASGEDTGRLVHVVPVKYTSGFESMPQPDQVRDTLDYVRKSKLPVVNMSFGIQHAWYLPEYVGDIYGYGGVVAAAGPNKGNDYLCQIGENDLDFYTDLWKDFAAEDDKVFTERVPNVKSFFDKILMVTSSDEYDVVVGACANSVLLDIAAPGKNILSLRPFNLMASGATLPEFAGVCKDDGSDCVHDPGYMYWKGTSFATPHVSATAALVLAMGGTTARDAWIWQEKAYSAIPGNAHDLGTAYRFDRLDMAATMNAIVTDTTPPAAPSGLWLSREPAPPDSKGRSRQATVLHWEPVWEGSIRYKVYRSEQADFQVGSESFLCYSDGTELRQIDPFIATEDPYYYRVTAVDQAGNESAATAAVSLGYDFIFMVSRSSHWVNPRAGYADTYFDSVQRLVGALAEKVPNNSRVGVLVFREKVFNEGTLRGVDGASGTEQRRTWSGDYALDALRLQLAPNEPWRKDYWYLDIGEVLEGTNEDAPWRGPWVSAKGSADALSLLSGGGERNTIGILISDWYDNSLAVRPTRRCRRRSTGCGAIRC